MGANGNIHPTRIFKKPDELMKAWEDYKKHLEDVEAEKWLKIQYVGKDGDRKEDAYKIPLTLEGFKVYCYKIYGVVEQYFKNQDNQYTDFLHICSYIKDEIRANQITGGLLGVYNPSITQRLNNLVEKTEDVTPPAAKKLKITIKKKTDEPD